MCVYACMYVCVFVCMYVCIAYYWKEGNILFNDALSTFYLQLYGVADAYYRYTGYLTTKKPRRTRHVSITSCIDAGPEGRESVSNGLRMSGALTPLGGTRCRHIGYYSRLAARVLLYAPSHRQDSTHHGLLSHQS